MLTGIVIGFILGVLVTLYLTKPNFKQKVNKFLKAVVPKYEAEDKEKK